MRRVAAACRVAVVLPLMTVAAIGALGFGDPVATALPAAPAASTAAPSLSVSPSSAAPGTRIVIDVSSRAPGLHTAAVCGNEARRGSVDCDLRGAQSVVVRRGREAFIQMVVTAPPAACPCVVRIADTDSRRIVVVPIVVVGHPVSAVVGPPTAQAEVVSVVVRSEPDSTFVDRLRRVLGGPVKETVVVEVTNTAAFTLEGVTVIARAGRPGTSRQLLDAPPAFTLPAGQSAVVELDVVIGAPTSGRYEVAGAVYAAGVAQTFAAPVSTTPWALAVLAILVVVDVAVGLVAWARRRRRPSVRLGVQRHEPEQVIDLRELAPAATEQVIDLRDLEPEPRHVVHAGVGRDSPPVGISADHRE